MKKIKSLLISTITAVTLILSNSTMTCAAVELPEGSVKGLPEALTVMDEDGHSVSKSGEYFFEVNNMVPYTPYSKNIQIMNLREDKAYHIYFYAEPISQTGEVELENNCTAVFKMDGKTLFEGKITGEPNDGFQNMSKEPLDLGMYEPGESHRLNCTVTWDGESADTFINFGKRLVDVNGEHVIESSEEKEYIEGETLFKWIFYAAVDETYQPPKTGVLLGDNTIYFVLIAIMAILIVIIGAMMLCKKKKLSQKK